MGWVLICIVLFVESWYWCFVVSCIWWLFLVWLCLFFMWYLILNFVSVLLIFLIVWLIYRMYWNLIFLVSLVMYLIFWIWLINILMIVLCWWCLCWVYLIFDRCFVLMWFWIGLRVIGYVFLFVDFKMEWKGCGFCWLWEFYLVIFMVCLFIILMRIIRCSVLYFLDIVEMCFVWLNWLCNSLGWIIS